MATTKKRKAPAKRKAPVRRRRSATLSAKPRARKKVTRRKKGMLSELFNPAMAKAGATSVLSGGVGGAGYGLMTKFLPEASVTKKIGFGMVGSFITAVLLQKPNIGAGISGATVFDAMKTQGMLAENMTAHKYANQVKSLPMVLDENGNELLLSNDDNMLLSENILDLAEYQQPNMMNFGG